jgi:GNAT superfamily N-acetyltransferase
VARTVLRPATLDDLDVLVLHRRLMWRDISAFDERTLDEADPAYRRWARNRLRSGKLVAWIVETGGRPVASGALWLQPVQPRPGRPFETQPYLLSMFTAPEHRGRGHAERIVRAAIAWCEERGHPYMSLHASHHGRPLYERLGFEPNPEMRLALKPKGPAAPARGRARRAAPAR